MVPVPPAIQPPTLGVYAKPIEMAFSKLKAHLRRIGARTISALWEAVGSICDLYTPDECRNYFRHAGYVSD